MLGNAQIIDVHIRDIVHGDFKVHIDGSNGIPNLRGNRRIEIQFDAERLFRAPDEFLESPGDFGVTEFGLGGARARGGSNGAVGALDGWWEGYFDEYVGAKVVAGHFGANEEIEFEVAGIDFGNTGEESKGAGEFLGESVVEYDEFSVGGNEGECAGGFPGGEVDTIVEIDVIENDTAVVALSPNNEVFVECETKLWVSGEI